MPMDPDRADPPWWRGATIYQIYPRSFQDSNGDGVGDLPGITQRLDHVAALGVGAIWVSPFYTSPMRDFGYDVSDYCDVDPVFGTLADFDAMVARAHALGIRVIVDQVYSHSSSDHPWFAESRSSRDNARANWYVWRDPKPDGSPPNNWQAVFGGPSWTWDGRRGQYYLHNFLPSQPQMNLHNPAVQQAMLDVARFWLERGVDGFRIDALNFAMFDPLLHDNPPAPPSKPPRTRPFDFQLHLHDQFHPDTVLFIERLRVLTDRYGAIFTLGEVGGDENNVEMKRFTRGEHRLNSAYGFDFLYAPALTSAFVAETMARWPGTPSASGEAEGWPSWAFENHDAPRALSRWCAPERRTGFAKLKMALLLALRGNVILYQGEELGLEQDDIPFEQLRDPEAIANWPRTLSRDGARTPMPWRDELLGGFTTGVPWLPLSPANRARAVAAQEADPGSLLHFTRDMLALRNARPALRRGAFEACEALGASLSFERTVPGERLRCLFNLGTEPLALPPPRAGARLLLSVNGASAGAMPAYSALFTVLHEGL